MQKGPHNAHEAAAHAAEQGPQKGLHIRPPHQLVRDVGEPQRLDVPVTATQHTSNTYSLTLCRCAGIHPALRSVQLQACRYVRVMARALHGHAGLLGQLCHSQYTRHLAVLRACGFAIQNKTRAAPGHAHVVQQRIHGHRVERERQRKLLRQRHREHACSRTISSRLQTGAATMHAFRSCKALTARNDAGPFNSAPVDDVGHAHQHIGQAEYPP